MVIRYSNLTKNLTYITTHVGGDVDPMPMFEQAMEMLAEGRIDVAPILTHVFDYRDFPEAYDKSSNYEDGVIKSLEQQIFTVEGAQGPLMDGSDPSGNGGSEPSGPRARGRHCRQEGCRHHQRRRRQKSATRKGEGRGRR